MLLSFHIRGPEVNWTLETKHPEAFFAGKEDNLLASKVMELLCEHQSHCEHQIVKPLFTMLDKELAEGGMIMRS